MEGGDANEAICRVCRCEETRDNSLFHPCKCTGSIKWIHQDCVLQWMHYSRKDCCELCRYRFSFAPIYAPNTPERLPLRDVLGGLFNSVLNGFKFWLHCATLIVCWIGFVPLVASNVFRVLFTKYENISAAIYDVFAIPSRLITIKEDYLLDLLHGIFIELFMMVAFVGVVWLREQVLMDNDHEWINLGNAPINVPPDREENEQDHMNIEQNDEILGLPVQNGNIPAAPALEPPNWNIMELERAVEDITWQRLLGLDGTYAFLEPLFCLVFLSSLFIMIFAYLPFHIGLYFVEMLRITKYVKAIQFEGFIYVLLGYFVIDCFFYFTYVVASLMSLERGRKSSKLIYTVIKVSLLLVLEFSVLPIIAGWWLDVCALTIFSGTLSDRLSSFAKFPGESTFVHWLAGIVFAYYFTTFILLLKDVLKPGIFSFLLPANLDFNPIQGMIRSSLFIHVTRIMMLSTMFGIAVILLIFVPGRILGRLAPTFLPYPVYDNLWNIYELSRVLFLLLPALLEEEHVRLWTRILITKWCWAVGKLLNLHTFLLGNAEQQNEGENNNLQPDALQQPVEHDRVEFPKRIYLWIRWFIFFVMVGLTLVACSLIALTIPVYFRRCAMFLWPNSLESALVGGTAESYELLCKARINRLYICWMAIEVFGMVRHWSFPRRDELLKLLKTFIVIIFKITIAAFWLVGVIPVLMGLLLELMFMIPLKVSNGQTPIMNITIAWAFGFLPLNILTAFIIIGSNSKLKRSLDRIIRNGFQGIDLQLTVVNTAIPISLMLSLMMAVPYVIAYSIIPFIVWDFKTRCLIARRIYPIVLFMICTSTVMSIGVQQFMKFHERVKNDKYLVGKRLVNYNHANT